MNPLDPDCPHDALLIAVDKLDAAIAVWQEHYHKSQVVLVGPDVVCKALTEVSEAAVAYHDARIAWEAV